MTRTEVFLTAKRIFTQCMELSEEGRERFLQKEAEKDPEAAEAARKMLQVQLPTGFLTTVDGDPHQPEKLIGTQVGPYEIKEFIASGGMGTVFKAERMDPHAVAAVKFIGQGMPAAPTQFYFEREAELLASLQHPRIVRYLDSFLSKYGPPILVMEFIEGVDLSPEIPELRDSVRQTVELLVKVCQAVEYMHSRAIVHRDLKPSNVLVRRTEKLLDPIIIDLGVARRLEDLQSPQSENTLGPVGTRHFMCPEQISGSVPANAQFDVYSLGAVLFYLLTGSPPKLPAAPYAGLNLPSQDLDVDLFGEARCRRRHKILRGDLDAVTAMALSPDPARRYANVSAFREDLQAWLKGRTVLARPRNLPQKLGRIVLHHPKKTLLATAVSSALILSWVNTARSEAELRLSNQQLLDEKENTQFVAQFFTDTFFNQPHIGLTGPETKLLDVILAAADTLSRKEQAPSPATLSIRGSLIHALSNMGSLEAAEEQFKIGRESAASIPATEPGRLVFDISYVNLLIHKEELEEAEELAHKVLARLREEERPNFIRIATVLNQLGNIHLSTGEFLAAEKDFQESLKYLDSSRLLFFEVSANLLLTERELLGPDPVLPKMKAFASQVHQQFGVEHPMVLILNINFSEFFLASGQIEPALKLLLQAKESCLAHPQYRELYYPTLLNNLATCFNAGGRYSEAIEMRKEVLEMRLARAKGPTPSVAMAYINLATNYLFDQQLEEALVHGQKGLDAAQSSLEAPHPYIAAAHNTLGNTYRAMGQKDQAIAHLRLAVDNYRRSQGDHQANLASIEPILEALEEEVQ
ncbi:MAG: hypothetical protein DWQ01_07510 [Planctomycetota bacterium]|nr:MAG: hypothetical protein DWQ01_07510 [Planctomycetota bacterium]